MTVIRVVGFVGDLLGLDLLAWLDLLGYMLDIQNAKKTAKVKASFWRTSANMVKVLANCVGNWMTTCQSFVQVNHQMIIQMIESLRTFLKGYIKDVRVPAIPSTDQPGPISQILDFILNNPIIAFFKKYSPFSKLVEFLQGKLDDMVTGPDLSVLTDAIANQLDRFADDEWDIVTRLVESVKGQLQDFINKKIDMLTCFMNIITDEFWSIFDSFELVVDVLFDMIQGLI